MCWSDADRGPHGAELEDLIGFFVNTLVLRARLKPGLSFSQLVADVKKTTLEAFQNQDVPFEKLVLELNPERTLSHSPLIQVLFSLQNIPALQEFLSSEGSADAGVSQNLDGHTGTAKFDFALFVSEGSATACSARSSSTPTCSRSRPSRTSATHTSSW